MPPLLRQSLLLIVVFAIVTAIASAAGAVNLGTAMTFGQVAFAAVLVFLMLHGTGAPGDSAQEADADASGQ
ncbi:MAG: hypothetical protein J7513_08555 [Solirubrobacteraceae bacterium]|nr:hypothetical protein [Solirubrobacteraceae bacterium]